MKIAKALTQVNIEAKQEPTKLNKRRLLSVFSSVVLMVGMICTMMIPAFATTVEEGNLAFGKTVINVDAINNASWQASNLTDGLTVATTGDNAINGFSTNNGRDSQDTVEAFTIDLSASTEFNRVIIYPRTGVTTADGKAVNFPENFQVQASDTDDFTGTTTVLADRTGITTTTDAPVTLDFTQTTARYVRLYVTKLGMNESVAGYRLQLSEFEIYNNNDLLAANTVKTLITNLPSPITSLTSATDVTDARTAYNNLTDTQQGLVTNYDTLTTAEAAIVALNQPIETLTNVALGKTVINADPIPAGTTDDWAASHLTDGNISTNFSTNNSDHNSQDAVEQFTIDLGASTTFSSVALFPRTGATTADGKAVNFPEDFQIQASDNADFSGTPTVLATKTGITTTIDKPVTIDFTQTSARYVRLYVTKLGNNETTTHTGFRLQLAEFEIYHVEIPVSNQTVADAVKTLITNLPSPITSLTSATAVSNARTAYNNLTETQKALITTYYPTLTAAEATIASLTAAANQAAADAVTTAINNLPTTITLNNNTAVTEVRNAYDALTGAQQILVKSDVLAKLVAAETMLSALNTNQSDHVAADAVTASINNLPATMTTDYQTTLTSIRTAYNALTTAQKALVTSDVLAKLTAAESAIAAIDTNNGTTPVPNTGDSSPITLITIIVLISGATALLAKKFKIIKMHH
jgi:LPXTG-motif cell wall-anchored protein